MTNKPTGSKTQTPVTCKDCHLLPTNGIYVKLCPLHAAAGELLAAAKLMRDIIRINDMAPSSADDSWDQWNESLVAILKAEQGA